jgi:hypothetical protein
MDIYCPGKAGVCSGGPKPHVAANETIVTGQERYESAHGQSASRSGTATHQ